MKKYLTIIAALFLAVASAVPQVFNPCYSKTLNRSFTDCTSDGCIYTICTPDCIYCDNVPYYTGTTCQQDEGWTAVLQGYGPGVEVQTKCINGKCTGGEEYGLPSEVNCWWTYDNVCSG